MFEKDVYINKVTIVKSKYIEPRQKPDKLVVTFYFGDTCKKE